MKRPAIFFDRDNTLIANDGYLGDPSKVVLLDGAADAVARARSLGFATVVVSNQSGVARGLFGEDDVSAVNRQMDEMLLEYNGSAVIDRHEFCPFHPEAVVELYRQDSDRRKPKPGMIFSAAEKLALDLSRSWVIGDAPRDIEAGHAAGCHTILIKHADNSSPAAAENSKIDPDFTVTNLKEAIDYVAMNLNDSVPPPPAGKITLARKGGPQPDRLEILADQILTELRRRNEPHHFNDFSVTKLLAGIAQVLALAIVLLGYLKYPDNSYYALMVFAIYLQMLTIALLIMGRQR